MYLKIKKYNNGKPIIYGLDRFSAPFGVNMAAADILPASDYKQEIPEGMFVVQVGAKARFLPRAKTKFAVATNSANVTLKAPCFSFAVGDVLYAKACFAEVAFNGSYATGDVVTLVIDGVSYSATVGATQTGAGAAAAFVSANSAALLTAGVTVAAKGSTNTITLIGTDAYSIAAYASAGGASIQVNTTDAGYLGDHPVPLGTILSIAAASSVDESRVVTLAANAAYALPAGVSVGVTVDKFLGIYPDPLDFTDEAVWHIAPIYEANGVYESNLPYVDGQVKRNLSLLNINKYFYKKA